MFFTFYFSLLDGGIPHSPFLGESELNIRMVEEIFECLEIPHKHEVQCEGIEMHQSILLIFFVQIPQEVDRIFLGFSSE